LTLPYRRVINAAMQGTWLIRGGRLVDPVTGTDQIGSLYMEKGVIRELPSPLPPETPCIDANGLTVVPGLIDLHVHLREPGNEQAETVASGVRAAARGGFTVVVAMPNTNPPLDTPEQVAALLARAARSGPTRVLPAPCITRRRQGRALADLAGLDSAGAVAFTDDGMTVADDEIMAAAMRLAAELGRPIMDHAQDPALARRGVMREGAAADRLSLPGMPAEAEIRTVRRDIELSAQTGCPLHLQHLSTAQAAELVREARQRGLPVSAEATPHHLTLCDEDILEPDPDMKMNPPLGNARDREALTRAVADGTIEALATDHAPHREAHKSKGFLAAPFGVVGLETAVPVTYTHLVRSGRMGLPEWLRRWTVGPARVLGLPAPSLAPGTRADVALLDLESEVTVQPESFLSLSRNTPFAGRSYTGHAVKTLAAGIVTWDEKGAD
jgi:dihydroorotase